MGLSRCPFSASPGPREGSLLEPDPAAAWLHRERLPGLPESGPTNVAENPDRPPRTFFGGV
jgi:hypothetical protein